MRRVCGGDRGGYYYKPRVGREVLAPRAGGLVALSGCLNSEGWRLLSADDPGRARATAGWYQEVFGRDNYFMEVQAHGLDEQRRVTAATIDIAKTIGAPIVGTNDSHYLEARHARAHEALLCIQTGSTMSDPKRWRFSPEEVCLKSAEGMGGGLAGLTDDGRHTLEGAVWCGPSPDVV